jgi:hypothetical protein
MVTALIMLPRPIDLCVAVAGAGIMITGLAGRCPLCALGGRGRG